MAAERSLPHIICCLTLSSCSVVMRFFPAFLNSGQAVFEGIHLPAGPLLPFNPAIRFVLGGRIHFPHSHFIVAK